MKFKMNRLINLALGLAMIDGGLVIGIQISDFLLTYFFLIQAMPVGNDIQSIVGMGNANILISVIGILNLAAIIYRITGIARGTKHNLIQCYSKGIRRLAPLFVLYFLGGITVIALSLQVSKFCVALLPQLSDSLALIIKATLLILLPYGVLTCATVVDQNKNPFQAIISTYNSIRSKGDFKLLAAISLMYSVPTILGIVGNKFLAVQYIALLTSLWFLFCHIITLVVYVDNCDKQTIQQSESKPSKVVII